MTKTLKISLLFLVGALVTTPADAHRVYTTGECTSFSTMIYRAAKAKEKGLSHEKILSVTKHEIERRKNDFPDIHDDEAFIQDGEDQLKVLQAVNRMLSEKLNADMQRTTVFADCLNSFVTL